MASDSGLLNDNSRTHITLWSRPTKYLTPREMDCIKLAGRGMTMKEIAMTLGISEQTVKNHMTLARARFHAVNTTVLVQMVLNPDSGALKEYGVQLRLF